MTVADQETDALDNILSQLQAEGYEVYRAPLRPSLPGFMKDYQPDAIAIGKGKNIAIEITTDSPNSRIRTGLARKLFEGRNDWDYRVVYAHPTAPRVVIDSVSPSAIEKTIATIEKLSGEAELQSALLISWAAFEALGRALLPERFARPQTPGRLVEILAATGYVTPKEADLVRELAASRNRLVHGDLGVTISKNSISDFSAILRTLLGFLKQAA
jgi:uncharacterized protein YutE (UPF0331/DUF86 family)